MDFALWTKSYKIGSLQSMEKVLGEVCGGGRLLRVPAPVLLPLRCAAAKGACPGASSSAPLPCPSGTLSTFLESHGSVFASISACGLSRAVSDCRGRFRTRMEKFPHPHCLFCRLIRSSNSVPRELRGTNRIDLRFDGGFCMRIFVGLRFLFVGTLHTTHTLTRTGS